MIAAYRVAGLMAGPALRRMLARRVAAGKEDAARVGERFGIPGLSRPTGRLVWFHAASVGETMSALPVIQAMGCEVLLTTGTRTSARLAEQRLPAHARHQFVPLDHPSWVAAFLAHWRPDAAVFVESELWPGILDASDSLGIPRLLINARISARSARNWRLMPSFARRVLGPFRYIHAQSAADAANLRALGASDVLEWGNLKFFVPELPGDAMALEVLRAAVPGPCWLAASTHPGEEALVLQAHQALLAEYPALVTLLVPRHPERGTEVAQLCQAPRRSLGETPKAGQVYVADTLGELGLFFRLVPFAFIGNSLVGFGGHNLIEPALLARPVITGPHVENFMEAASMLRGVGALVEVADAPTLARAVGGWLATPEQARGLGLAARSVFQAQGDLPERLARLIRDCALA